MNEMAPILAVGETNTAPARIEVEPEDVLKMPSSEQLTSGLRFVRRTNEEGFKRFFLQQLIRIRDAHDQDTLVWRDVPTESDTSNNVAETIRKLRSDIIARNKFIREKGLWADFVYAMEQAELQGQVPCGDV